MHANTTSFTSALFTGLCRHFLEWRKMSLLNEASTMEVWQDWHSKGKVAGNGTIAVVPSKVKLDITFFFARRV